MIVTEVRFDVELISATAFAEYMRYRAFTVRSLAARVGCSHSLIGHLRSGERKSCKPELARQIEKALDAPRGSLFVPRLSRVQRERGRAAA